MRHPSVSIGELERQGAIIEIQDGNHGEKHPVSSDYVVTGIPFLMASDIRDGMVDLETCKFITREQSDSLRIGFARGGDVLLTHKGTVGNVAVLPEVEDYVMLTPQVTYYRVDSQKLSNQYLRFAFCEPGFQDRLLSRSAQSTRPYIGVTAQRDLEIFWCARREQEQIAAILSAYCDLIANITRRIRILEQMAQMIYREWFVNFRFPDYHAVKLVKWEKSRIPKGWQVQKVTAAVDVAPPTKVPKDGLKPFVPMGSLSHTSMLISDIEQREGNGGSKFRNGDTLFARITPCLENGKTGFVQFLPNSEAVGFGSTEFIVLRSRTLTPEYVYLMARSQEFRDNAIKSMSGATGRQRVQDACFDRFLIAHPPAELLQCFQSTVRPMFRLIHALNSKNENLRQTRDLLLPKLVSGEISVETAEREAVAQGA
jgi:type I restriction enzyme S subunit